MFRARYQDLPIYTPQDSEALRSAVARRVFYILKLYGSLERADEVLVSPAQCDKAIAENLAFQTFMEGLVVSGTILFVGCSLEGIEAYLKGLRFRGQSGVRHYALSGVLGTSYQAMAGVLERRYGICVIPYRSADPADQLNALRELRRCVMERKMISAPLSGSVRLKKIVLTNIGPFEQQEITLDPTVNLIVGNNGMGKSTVLRAIATALCGKEAEPFATRLLRVGTQTGRIEIETEADTYQTVLQRTSSGGVEVTSLPARLTDATGILAIAFPALRTTAEDSARRVQRPGTPYPTTVDVLPLISGDIDSRLSDFHTWLVDLDYRAKHERSRASNDDRFERLIDTFFKTLGRLLDGLQLKFDHIDPASKQIRVITDDGSVPFEYVSQGTASLIGWVGVLLQRLYEIYGTEEDPTNRYALLLLDEIDAHMHPTWQQTLLRKINAIFPNLQLIATTHSPLLVGGLSSDQVLHMVRAVDTRVVNVRRYELKLKGLETDAVLTGPLFGLEDTRDFETQTKERRYDELRAMRDPSESEVTERIEIAKELFGPNSQDLDARTASVVDVLENSIKARLSEAAPEEAAQKLSDAERLVNRILAHRR